MAMNDTVAAKFTFMGADDLKIPKTGPLAWAALSAGLAYKRSKLNSCGDEIHTGANCAGGGFAPSPS